MKWVWFIQRVVFHRCHGNYFALVVIICPQWISLSPYLWHMSSSTQTYLLLPLFHCRNILRLIRLNILCMLDLMNLWSCEFRDSVPNSWSTFAIGDFQVVFPAINSFFEWNHFSALSRAVRDGSQCICWLPRRENSYDTCTALINNSSVAVSTLVYLSSLELSTIDAQFTDSILIMTRITFSWQEPHVDQSNALQYWLWCWYCGTNANRLTNSFLTFVAFWNLSRQYSKPWPKSQSSWCNSSGRQSW